MIPLDDKALRKMAAAAEHEAKVAEAAAEAVPRVANKLKRAEADVKAAVVALDEAEQDAADCATRAEEAREAYRSAADGVPVTAQAQTAQVKGKAN